MGKKWETEFNETEKGLASTNSYIIFKTIQKDREFHVFRQKLAEEISEDKKKKNNRKYQREYRKLQICPLLLSRQSLL